MVAQPVVCSLPGPSSLDIFRHVRVNDHIALGSPVGQRDLLQPGSLCSRRELLATLGKRGTLASGPHQAIRKFGVIATRHSPHADVERSSVTIGAWPLLRAADAFDAFVSSAVMRVPMAATRMAIRNLTKKRLRSRISKSAKTKGGGRRGVRCKFTGPGSMGRGASIEGQDCFFEMGDGS